MFAVSSPVNQKFSFWPICASIVFVGLIVSFQLPDQPRSHRTFDIDGQAVTPVALRDSDDDAETTITAKAEDLVKDWEKPDVTLFVTGRQHGYIEPCGCTGLKNQKGGLMRRHSVLKVLLERGWDVLPIDAGNQIRRYGQQPLIKLQKTYDALCKEMDYQSVAFGPDDLKLGTIDLVQVLLNAQADDKHPFTCANVVLMGEQGMTHRFQILECNGRKIGITCIIGDEHIEKLKANDELTIIDVQSALREIVPQMRNQNCDMMVLTAQTSLERCRELAKRFPVFDLLVTTGGAGDPTLHPEQITANGHTTQMIQVGVKGMYVGVVGLYAENSSQQIKYKRVPLDARFSDSPEMVDMFINYQTELKTLYEQNANEDIRPRPHKSGYQFVGSQACEDCHFEEYAIWEEGSQGEHGPHYHATDSLVDPKERGFVARHYDPECLSCHVTGWNPQSYYPYESGFLDLKKDAALHGNGCENCHGPGSAHVAAEEDDNDEELQERLRKFMRLTIEEAKAKACMECHDLDNSPDFLIDGAWEKYWPQIEH